MKKVKTLFTWITLVLLFMVLSACGGAGQELKTIRLDYATYSPLSLVIKHQGWAEEEFGKENIKVEWTLSQGSNKALEFITSKSVDFSSASGAASLISRSKGVPIQAIYGILESSGVAIMAIDESIAKVEDLKGKKVAATYGTDPHIFLLLALQEANMSIKDIEYVNLQHNDGYQALLKGDVDAWVGLDPITATAELESDARMIYQNPDFTPKAVLNVHEDFAKAYPEAVEKVIALYERARQWIAEHPDQLIELLAEESKITTEVAKIQLSRADVSKPVLKEEDIEKIVRIGAILQDEEIISPDVDMDQLARDFVNPTYTENIKE